MRKYISISLKERMTRTHRRKGTTYACTHREWREHELPPDHGTPVGETVTENVPTLEFVDQYTSRCTQCRELVKH